MTKTIPLTTDNIAQAELLKTFGIIFSHEKFQQNILTRLLVDMCSDPASQYLVTGYSLGHESGLVRLWDLDTATDTVYTPDYQPNVVSVAISPDRRLIAAGGLAGLVTIWDRNTKQVIKVLKGEPGPKNYVRGLTFSSDSRLLATGDRYDKVRIWNTGTFEQIAIWDDFSPWKLVFDNGDRFLVGYITSYSDEKEHFGVLRIWNVETAEVAGDIELSGFNGLMLTSFTDETVVTGAHFRDGHSNTKSLSVYRVNLSTDERELLFEDSFPVDTKLFTMAVSPDRQLLAFTANDTVVVWDIEKRQKLRVCQCSDEVHFVTFTPDSMYLIVASMRGHIYLWGIAA